MFYVFFFCLGRKTTISGSIWTIYVELLTKNYGIDLWWKLKGTLGIGWSIWSLHFLIPLENPNQIQPMTAFWHEYYLDLPAQPGCQLQIQNITVLSLLYCWILRCVEVHSLHPKASHDGVNIEVGLFNMFNEKDRSFRFSSLISTRPIPLVATCPKRNDDHQFNIQVCIEVAEVRVQEHPWRSHVDVWVSQGMVPCARVPGGFLVIRFLLSDSKSDLCV